MEKEFELFAPCHFGLEAVLKREILDLGYEVTEVTDGRVSFKGDEAAVARANVFLRTTERVMIKVGSFKAESFDELFEGTKALPWERYIPKNGRFWVKKAASIKSKLFSPSDIQRIMKKAMVDKLGTKYGIIQFPEDGANYPVRVSIMKDEVTVGIDTSGESLHKRGYRKNTVKAPITETLAAALISLTPWKKDRILIDPFCGGGTIPIEAAMMGLNIAPGYDIDGDALEAARSNAALAGVSESIHFQKRDVRDLSSSKKYGFIITNPPYGERLEEKAALPELYKTMGEAFGHLDSWSYFIITGFEDAEKYIGKKPDKNRKIYNGMMKTYFYSYMGPKPTKRCDT